MAEHLRTIIREDAFEDEVHALIADVETADQFMEAAEVLLARDPKIGTRVASHSDVWLLPMSPIGGEEVYLYYTFDDEAVISSRFVALHSADRLGLL